MALVELRGHKTQPKVMSCGKWTAMKEGVNDSEGRERKDGSKESKCIPYLYEAVKGLN